MVCVVSPMGWLADGESLGFVGDTLECNVGGHGVGGEVGLDNVGGSVGNWVSGDMVVTGGGLSGVSSVTGLVGGRLSEKSRVGGRVSKERLGAIEIDGAEVTVSASLGKGIVGAVEIDDAEVTVGA